MQLNATDTVKCHSFLQLFWRFFIISFTFLPRVLFQQLCIFIWRALIYNIQALALYSSLHFHILVLHARIMVASLCENDLNKMFQAFYLSKYYT